jgi:hypothetical protein
MCIYLISGTRHSDAAADREVIATSQTRSEAVSIAVSAAGHYYEIRIEELP